MNPLLWKREHQVAGVDVCLIGAAAGLLFAWLDSPMHKMAAASLSGEWANPTRVFLEWLPYYQLYWPWPALGALVAGLGFYALKLGRT
jgi:hypothetical protein